jgi:hypothetical protein
MNLKFRLTRETDYEELSKWWDAWSFPKPTIEMLDNLRHGIMVYLDDVNICCGFIYFTNAEAFGLIEFIVSNNDVKDKETRKLALIFLINTLNEYAKRKGIKCLFTSLQHPNLVKHYEACGYVKGSTNTIEMIKML